MWCSRERNSFINHRSWVRILVQEKVQISSTRAGPLFTTPGLNAEAVFQHGSIVSGVLALVNVRSETRSHRKQHSRIMYHRIAQNFVLNYPTPYQGIRVQTSALATVRVESASDPRDYRSIIARPASHVHSSMASTVITYASSEMLPSPIELASSCTSISCRLASFESLNFMSLSLFCFSSLHLNTWKAKEANRHEIESFKRGKPTRIWGARRD